MRTVARQRRYVSPGTLMLCRPVLAFDYNRGAYILRGVGERIGPVLRQERRSGGRDHYAGPERRLVGELGERARADAHAPALP